MTSRFRTSRSAGAGGKLNRRVLAVLMSCLMLTVLLSCIHPYQADSTHAVAPVALAGAGTEADTEAGADTDTSDRQAGRFLSSVLDSVKSTGSAALATPAEKDVQESMQDAATITTTALNAVRNNRIMSDTDYQTLLQIVEAECTGGDVTSKQLVANVILNRVDDEHFPDTVYEVVYQKLYGQAQFSPVSDGRMGTLAISDSTVEAVNAAVSGDDNSQGALFFMARKYAARSNVAWFDSELVMLYSYGGHDFYTFK